ncbi:hypothetical protein ACTFIW_008290 [Dictyostelium discoideum]
MISNYCKLIPCCVQCTSSKGEHHGHKTDPLESSPNILSLMNNFKNDVYQKVIERIEINETILKQSNDKYNKIQSQFDINNNSLRKEIKKIHDIIWPNNKKPTVKLEFEIVEIPSYNDNLSISD